MKFSRKKVSGFSLAELVVGLAIMTIGMTGVYGLFLYVISTLRTADNSAIASKHLNQRLEQLQGISDWSDLTNPSFIKTLLSTPVTTTAQILPGMTQESITISAATIPYANPVPNPIPAAVTYTPFTVARTTGTGGGTVSSTATSSALSGAGAVIVRLSITWQDGRSHTRQISTILSSAGITRLTQ